MSVCVIVNMGKPGEVGVASADSEALHHICSRWGPGICLLIAGSMTLGQMVS